MEIKSTLFFLLGTFTTFFSLSLTLTFFFGSHLFEEEDVKFCEEETICLTGLLMFRYMTAFVSLFFVFFMAFFNGGKLISLEAWSIIVKEYSQVPRIINNILNHWIIKWLYDFIFDWIMYAWSWLVIPFTYTTKLSVVASVFLILTIPFAAIYYIFINWKWFYESVKKSLEEEGERAEEENKNKNNNNTNNNNRTYRVGGNSYFTRKQDTYTDNEDTDTETDIESEETTTTTASLIDPGYGEERVKEFFQKTFGETSEEK